MEQKNTFLKSKVRSKIPFSASPLGFLLAACGGGGGSESSSNDNSSTITTSTSTNTSGHFGSNSNNLSAFAANSTNNFSGEYSTPEQLSSPTLDQTFSESYLSDSKDNTSLVNLTGINEIDGLLYADRADPNKTLFWKVQGSENYISFSFFDIDKVLLDEVDYTQTTLTALVYNNNFYEITQQQKEDIRLALNEFEKVLNVKFVEVTEQNNQVGTIRFGISQADFDSAAAFAQVPGRYWAQYGDIWMDKDFANGDFSKGSYEFGVYLHEIGHAMGLAHPHEDGLPGAEVLRSEIDYTNYTQMSYNDPTWAYFGSIMTIAESLMVYDIQALQHMYGANDNYNAGNTKYEFDPAKPNSLTIWDAGGEDLLDFSNFNYRCDIDLNDGAYSTIRYAGWNPDDNFGIAFNTFIENVSGSQANDTIIGNELDNEISGNNGNDTLFGGAGNDVFNWATDSRGGTDTMHGGSGNDTFVLDSANDIVLELVGEGIDTVYTETSYSLPSNVENVFGYGTQGNLTIKGNDLDNVLCGSELNDILEGGDGADDFLLYIGMGNDQVTDFNSSEGDEVLLAYGLTGYQLSNTLTGAIYSLEDGSSLELVYEFIA